MLNIQVLKSIFFLLLFLSANTSFAQPFSIQSPDHNITVTIDINKEIRYSVKYKNEILLLPSLIDLEMEGGKKLSDNLRITKTRTRSVNEIINSPVPEKRRIIPDVFQELEIELGKQFNIDFRVYNDGVAYRIISKLNRSLVITNETAQFVFQHNKRVLMPVVSPRQDADRFHTSFEENYKYYSIDSLEPSSLAYTPVLAGKGDEIKIAITESDLENYPGMFLSKYNEHTLQGVYAPYPLEEKMTSGEFPQLVVTKREPYIARINAYAKLPWRVLMISSSDRDLPGNDVVYRLASPSRIKNTEWIHPGKGTDEWIIGINLFNVPFKAGINTATYKYYIDFASRFGFNRIMMDAGWSDYKDLFKINPSLDMDTLVAYAKSKNIRLSMWTLCSTLDRQLDSALDQFKRWGVDFIMTDFMDRDDQKMVNFYHRIARACAEKNIMIMYHGAFPPKGFNRTWPNAITREGVLGSEFNIWSNRPDPEHDVTLPFTRMLAGPMDYEPGLLDNATKNQFKPISQKVMSQGTRCHQLSMFVVYDSPIQIFSGNPSQGYLEPEFMELLGSIPTIWDETKILEARVSDYIITARKNGNDWFIAGMNDWNSREFDLSLDFLDAKKYSAVLCADGINADNYPSDYKITMFEVSKNDKMKIKMAPGGGFVLKLKMER